VTEIDRLFRKELQEYQGGGVEVRNGLLSVMWVMPINHHQWLTMRDIIVACVCVSQTLVRSHRTFIDEGLFKSFPSGGKRYCYLFNDMLV
jgi:hypothetical protein